MPFAKPELGEATLVVVSDPFRSLKRRAGILLNAGGAAELRRHDTDAYSSRKLIL